MKHEPLKADGSLTMSIEGGNTYIGHHVDIDATMDYIKKTREKEALATRQSNPNGWHRIGTVPEPVLHGWLIERGYTRRDYAINAGGTKLGAGQDPFHWIKTDPGVKARFWKWFLANRDFAKLHNHHVTTKKESTSFSVPSNYRKTDAGIIVPGNSK